jgi:hypothetical protein
MQIKTTVRHFTAVSMAIVKQIVSAGEDTGKREHMHTVGRIVN